MRERARAAARLSSIECQASSGAWLDGARDGAFFFQALCNICESTCFYERKKQRKVTTKASGRNVLGGQTPAPAAGSGIVGRVLVVRRVTRRDGRNVRTLRRRHVTLGERECEGSLAGLWPDGCTHSISMRVALAAAPSPLEFLAVPVLVPVRASPVPSVVRGSFVVKFFLQERAPRGKVCHNEAVLNACAHRRRRDGRSPRAVREQTTLPRPAGTS